MMYMYLKKIISKKTLNIFFVVEILAWSMTKIAGSGPDPIVRGMDPRIQIRIRIHPKMSWIRNTGGYGTDPPPYPSDAILRTLVYRRSRASF
jgi:hypothetical protein